MYLHLHQHSTWATWNVLMSVRKEAYSASGYCACAVLHHPPEPCRLRILPLRFAFIVGPWSVKFLEESFVRYSAVSRSPVVRRQSSQRSVIFTVIHWVQCFPKYLSSQETNQIYYYVQRTFQLLPIHLFICALHSIHIYMMYQDESAIDSSTFIRSNLIDISTNTYIRNWTVTEMMTRENLRNKTCYTYVGCQTQFKKGGICSFCDFNNRT